MIVITAAASAVEEYGDENLYVQNLFFTILTINENLFIKYCIPIYISLI